MRIPGPEYPIRDGTGEWGAFRPGTIEALAHVGKVTGGEEVRLGDGRWVPILTVPELHKAITGEEGGQPQPPAQPPTPAPSPAASPSRPSPASPAGASGARTTSATATQAAPAPATSRPVTGPQAFGTTAPAPGPPTAAGPVQYEVIKADGTMLPGMILPLIIANIRDGNVGPDDLIARAGSAWVPARDLPELGGAFAAGVRDGATPERTGQIPKPASAPAPTPAPAGPAAPPKERARTPTPTVPLATPRPTGRDLSRTPFGMVLGQLLRERATGQLIVNGPSELTVTLKDGHPIGAQVAGGADRTKTGEFLVALGAPAGAAEPRAMTAARSAAAVTDVLSAFSWDGGAWRFEPSPVGQPPQFWVHPWELQRAGMALAGWGDRVRALTAAWTDAMVQLPGAQSLGAMPLSDGERAAFGLIDGGATFGQVLAAAAAQGVQDDGLRRTLLVAANLGLATVGAPPPPAPEVPLTGPAILGSGRDAGWIVRQLGGLDDAAVLAIGPDADDQAVQAAYVAVVDLLKDFPGTSDVRNRVLQRLNVAHRALADGARQRREAREAAEAPAVPPPAAGVEPGPAAAAAGAGEDDELEAAMRAAMESGALAGATGGPAPRPAARPREERGATPARADTRDLLVDQNFQEAMALVDKGKWQDAQRILRRLVQVSPLDGRFHGWLGWCTYQLNKKNKNAVKKAIDELERSIRLRPEDPELPYLLGSLYHDAGDPRRAEKAFQAVLRLDPRHEGALAELKGVAKAQQARRKRQQGARGEPQELLPAGAIYLLILGLCFVAANVAGHDPDIQAPNWQGWGEKEYFYYHDNWWFWARRILLLLAGVIGVKVFLKDDRLDSVKPVEFTILGVLYGGIYGFISAFVAGRVWPQDQDGKLIEPMVAAMLGMVVFHAVAEEFFFRRFLTRVIQRVITNVTAGAALSGLMFGVYHLSYTAFWWGLMAWNPELPAYSMPMQGLSMAMTWGLPLALLFMWSRSIAPSMAASLVFGASYGVISLLRATGGI